MIFPAARILGLSLLVASASSGCQQSSAGALPPAAAPPPKPPVQTAKPLGRQRITGTERLAWEQAVRPGADIAAHEFTVYIDGIASPLRGVECGPTPGPSGYPCSAPFPSMAPGDHRLRLVASYEVDGTRRDGPASGFIFVTRIDPNDPSGTADGSGVQQITVVSNRIGAAADLAIAEDGRLLLAERRGRIHVVSGGTLAADPALELDDVDVTGGRGLFAVTLHPDFAKNGLVYYAYAARTPSGPVHRVSRGRLVAGRIGQVANLREAGPAADGARVVLRFGPDRKLYVGVGGTAARPDDFAGKILRLNDDGTTPRDNPTASPVVSAGHTGLSGIAFTPKGTAVLRRGAAATTEIAWFHGALSFAKGGATPVVLRADGPIAGFAYAPARSGGGRDELILARADGGVVPFRAVGAPARPGEVVDIVAASYGPARAIGVAPDGTIYVATANGDIPGGKAEDYLLAWKRSPR